MPCSGNVTIHRHTGLEQHKSPPNCGQARYSSLFSLSLTAKHPSKPHLSKELSGTDVQRRGRGSSLHTLYHSTDMHPGDGGVHLC